MLPDNTARGLRAGARTRWRAAGPLLALVALAVAVRGAALGSPPLWADEAESAINALTVVARGVPVDRFLGLPLFENTLVRPWPGSEEYEFRDLSYSDRGVAVYHGWLPLYAIAGAFRLAGVTPAEARRGTPPEDGSTAELERWTAVPRWPSVAFSALFVVSCFALGRALYGSDAGWAMALAAALSNILVFFGRQARYYSATLALDAAGGLAVWNACRRGRPLDHVLAGLAVGLLFHTHALAAVVMAPLYALALLASRGQPGRLAKGALGAAVAAAAVLPWAWWSGFLAQSTRIPPAREMLDLASLLRSLPTADPLVLSTNAAGLAWLVAAALLGPRLGERWRRPVLEHAPAFAFALGWVALSYLGFVALIPAASYFVLRLKLAVAVPGLAATTLVVAAAARAVTRGRWPVLAPAAMLALLLLSGQLPRTLRPEWDASVYDLARLVRSWRLGPGARVYASPNSHLVLTYYTGLPVQSVGAVRRSWLERFDRDLVLIDDRRYQALPPGEVEAIARRHGRPLAPAEAKARSDELRWLVPAIDVALVAAEIRPAPRPLDALDRALVDAVRERTRREMERLTRGTPLARAATLADWREFWQYFFYWFARPETRLGERLNAWTRLRTSRAHVLPGGEVVYDCRPVREPPLVAP
jgi:4-amino-4-deoxy-L-arabinose transferase-like glycosyltransferase